MLFASAIIGTLTLNSSQPIATLGDLLRIRNNNTGDYYLTSDIDASSTSSWNDEGTDSSIFEGWPPFLFSGKLDGRGHAIRHLTVRRPHQDFVGLFSEISTGQCAFMNPHRVPEFDRCQSKSVAQISNISIEFDSISGKDYVGGIAGTLRNTKISATRVKGVVHGRNMVGGIAGSAGPWVSISGVDGNITISGRDDVGGLIGAGIHIRLDTAHLSGKITGRDRIGGLVGGAYGSRLRGLSSDAEIEGSDTVGGIIGISIGTKEGAAVITSRKGTESLALLLGEDAPQDINYGYTQYPDHSSSTVISSGRVWHIPFDNRISNSVFSGALRCSHWCGGIRGSCRSLPLSLVRCINSGIIIGKSHVGGFSGSSQDLGRNISLIQAGVVIGDSSAGFFGDSLSPISDAIISSPLGDHISCRDLSVHCISSWALGSVGHGELHWTASIFPDGLWGTEKNGDMEEMQRHLGCDQETPPFFPSLFHTNPLIHFLYPTSGLEVHSTDQQKEKIGNKFEPKWVPPIRSGARVIQPRVGCVPLKKNFSAGVTWDEDPLSFNIAHPATGFAIRSDSLCRFDSIPISGQPVILEVRSALGGLLRLMIPSDSDIPDTSGYLRSCPLWPEGMP